MTKSDDLTPKERLFIVEYMVDMNGTQAAIRAGYSPRTARVIAQELLERPRVQKALKAAMDARLTKVGVTAEMVLEELRRVAFADPRKLMTWDANGLSLKSSADLSDAEAAAIAEVIDTRTKDGGGQVKIKLHSKMDGLDRLGRHFRLFDKDEKDPGTTRLVLQVDWPDGTPVPARMKKLRAG